MEPITEPRGPGRIAGVPNMRTTEALERERIHEQLAYDPQQAVAAVNERVHRDANDRRKLAKERLEELMEIAIGCAAYYQPSVMSAPTLAESNENANWEQFKYWHKTAADCANKLWPTQSPTFRAIVVAPPPDPNAGKNRRRHFTLTVFDGGRQMKPGSTQPLTPDEEDAQDE